MTAAADRHLLFGLLALQTGIINEGQLLLAFQAWTLDKSKSLADHLEARGDLNGPKRAALEALAAVHVETHDGDLEKSLASVPANRSTRASLAALGDPEIEGTLTRVTRNHNGHASEPDDDPDRTATLSVGAATSDGQRFRLLRPHARGGLGEVFVALDAELHREVALKQILEKHADDPVSRQRFVAEAEITGGLEHPGVVPVYGLGTYGGGRPYYAMRFIKGDSLKEAIEQFHGEPGRVSAGSGAPRKTRGAHATPLAESGELGRVSAGSPGEPGRVSAGSGAPRKTRGADATPLAFRKLLRRFLDVCNAIDYAHSRGVIHRDIKPANIILGKHGETLMVDWGLAKAIGRADPSSGEQTIAPSSSGSSETLPGSALGTPAYMSPEQAAGDLHRLGPRSDVYSLGATLYCLLTGKPPQGGDDVGELLRRVQCGDFPRPRQLDPSIDRPLEAVCLKAMATKPEDRYSSCRPLAEDIERWMADEPVTAWREPVLRRARRWAKRNRTAVATAGVALLAGVVGLAAVLLVQTQAKADIARALASETRANAELARSKAAVQARYDLAVEAIKTFHTGVNEDFLLNQDQFKELRDRLLKSASDFYGRLSALLGQETDLASRHALAASNYELAELTRKVGRIEGALAAHQAALAAREALAAETGATAEIKSDVGRSLTAVASLLYSTGRIQEALAAYRRGESLLAGLASFDPEARAALAACRSRLGELLLKTGTAVDALVVYRHARADQEALASAPGASTEIRRELATTLNGIGWLLSRTGRRAEAEVEHRRALEISQRLADDYPTIFEFRRNLAQSHHNLGILLSDVGKLGDADAEFRQALAIRRKLVDDHPAVTEFLIRLAHSHHNLGGLLSGTGKFAEAEAEYRQALSLYRKLAADHPAVADFRSDLGMSHNNLGSLLSLTAKLDAAEAEYRTALAIQRKLVDDNPAVTEFRNRLARTRLSLGWLLYQRGDSSEAEGEYRKALAIERKLVEDNPAVTTSRSLLASSYFDLATLLSQTGRPTEAEAAYRAAIALCRKLADENPAVTDFRFRLADSHSALAWVLSQAGNPSGAEAECRLALPLYRDLVDDNPRVPLYRHRAADLENNLSLALRRLGRPAEARDHAERAGALHEALAREHPTTPDYRAGLAENAVNRGLACLDLGDPAGAAADFWRALGLYDGLSSRSVEQWFLSACSHSALSGLGGRTGSGVSSSEASSQAQAAMTLLHKAVSMGYRNPDAYRSEDALDPLRGREDFRLLMMDLAFPAKPFARGE
jgi:serine/threonine-protein kinase